MDERSQRGSLLSPVDPSLAGEVKGGAVGGDSLHGHWGKAALIDPGLPRPDTRRSSSGGETANGAAALVSLLVSDR